MLAAVAVFGLAAGLAFALNGDDGESGVLVAAQPGTDSTAIPGVQAPAATDQSAADAPATPPVQESAGEEPAADAEAALDETATEQSAPPLAAADVSPLQGFIIPIAGACIPESELLLPGAPRAYRNGTHQGVDLYSGAVGGCPADLAVTRATPILAAKTGMVTRADVNYVEITQAEIDAASAAGFQGEQILDTFRGRQVWIDHGDGVVTRYAHLGAIAAGLAVGQTVQAGRIIAFAGESGTIESVQAPGTDIHLHFEIRVDEAYLGQGLSTAEARRLYLEALGLVEPATGG